ncbi:MFS transporter [Campylobacter geochelonis]|uniref:Putative integral membrane protein n=1 Tax=Campylobacter geochelonis TaxID=1780362 RepID=A0A128EHD9_9BACT|nr:MFS transporter [Campylobacter geochelonis]QKF71633.1 proton antiporter protein, major facilitator superfamily [Campylobacter geochelonis]CZE48389.1 putative integral membrane protein [Campylobacter geochelonis]CZE49396.1 putative integral membrane protein [Campylobacter geochelonis]CZE51559.1 putative integral membrane protein [Campylobacter geochelonis]
MKKYLNLLKSNQTVRLLSIIQLICYFGMWFSHIGIFTLLIELNAEVWMISLTAAMAFIPSVILAPFSGVIIDKFKALPLLMIFMVIEAVTILMLLFINDLSYFWFLQVLVFLRMGVGGIYFQVEMSLLPKILNKDELKLANEIHSIIWGVCYTAGMGLAGIFIHFFGIYTSFLVDFFIYVVGIYLLTRIKLDEKKSASNVKAINMIKEGILYIKSNPLLANLILVHAFVAVTAYDALISIMADHQYKGILSTALIIGLINTMRALGLVAGPILLSKFVNNRTLFWLFLGEAAGIVFWAVLQFNFYISFIGLFFAGLCTSVVWSYTYTLVQTHCDKKYYGRVVAYVDMIYLGTAAITSLMTGLLYSLGLGTFGITMLIAIFFILAAFYYKWVYKKWLRNG